MAWLVRVPGTFVPAVDLAEATMPVIEAPRSAGDGVSSRGQPSGCSSTTRRISSKKDSCSSLQLLQSSPTS